MTRTIITADGTRLRDDTRTRRTIRRMIFAALIIAGMIFISAAVIGLATAHPHTTAPAKGHSIADYNRGRNAILADIRALAARPATRWTNPDGSIGEAPNGTALLQECLSDSSLTPDEFYSCITAPTH